jgi:hypothetical protein
VGCGPKVHQREPVSTRTRRSIGTRQSAIDKTTNWFTHEMVVPIPEPQPEPEPIIDPNEPVPDDPAELLPDAPEPLPPAPIESTPDDPGGDPGGVPEPV